MKIPYTIHFTLLKMDTETRKFTISALRDQLLFHDRFYFYMLKMRVPGFTYKNIRGILFVKT